MSDETKPCDLIEKPGRRWPEIHAQTKRGGDWLTKRYGASGVATVVATFQTRSDRNAAIEAAAKDGLSIMREPEE